MDRKCDQPSGADTQADNCRTQQCDTGNPTSFLPNAIINNPELSADALTLLAFKIYMLYVHWRASRKVYVLNKKVVHNKIGLAPKRFHRALRQLINLGYLKRWRRQIGASQKQYASERVTFQTDSVRNEALMIKKAHIEMMLRLRCPKRSGILLYMLAQAPSFIVTALHVQQRFGVSRKTANGYLSSLVELGVIRRTGKWHDGRAGFTAHLDKVAGHASRATDGIGEASAGPVKEGETEPLVEGEIGPSNIRLNTNTKTKDSTLFHELQNTSTNSCLVNPVADNLRRRQSNKRTHGVINPDSWIDHCNRFGPLLEEVERMEEARCFGYEDTQLEFLARQKYPEKLRRAASGRIGHRMLSRDGLKGFITLVWYAVLRNERYGLTAFEAAEDVTAEVARWAKLKPDNHLNSWQPIGLAMMDRPLSSKSNHVRFCQNLYEVVESIDESLTEDLWRDRPGLSAVMERELSAGDFQTGVDWLIVNNQVATDWQWFSDFRRKTARGVG